MALILLLIGFLDSTFALIGQNEPIYETSKQLAKKFQLLRGDFSNVAVKIILRLYLLRKKKEGYNLKKVEVKW